MIFAVFDVLLAVNMCINYRFFTFIIHMSQSLVVSGRALTKMPHVSQKCPTSEPLESQTIWWPGLGKLKYMPMKQKPM